MLRVVNLALIDSGTLIVVKIDNLDIRLSLNSVEKPRKYCVYSASEVFYKGDC